jgi:hypothetical protein
MRVRRVLATGSMLVWMLACGGGTDATPISDISGQGGASANAGGNASSGTAGASTGLSGGTAAGGAMGAGGTSETGGAGGSAGGVAGSAGSTVADAQVGSGGNLDAGSDVAVMQEAAPPDCLIHSARCHACIDTDPAGLCYAAWKACDTDPNMCAGQWKIADDCACGYEKMGSTMKAVACINQLAQGGVTPRNLEACINSNCSKECGLAL